MRAYYNEFEPYAAQWLRNLISAGHIAPGDVDERSIVDVGADDLKGYTQCHFFAGIGGWSLAARLAGWPDERELWTGSCPCQPFSVAGKGEGQADERHLWPEQFRLISARRPAVWMGEQVAAAVGKHWLDGVHSDLESIGYACGAAVVPACAIDAPHRRDRAWIVADTATPREGRRGVCRPSESAGEVDQRPSGQSAGPREGVVANADQSGEGQGWEQRGGEFSGFGGHSQHRDVADTDGPRSTSWLPAAHGGRQGDAEIAHHRSNRRPGPWGECDWLEGADGKARRFEPSIRLLAHGVPARVGKLRAYGNAIVPQVAAEVIAAFMEARP